MARSTRREFLQRAAGLGLVIALRPGVGEATPAAMQDAVRRVVGSAPVTPGRVKLEIPPLSENGNTVPLTVTVESPMSAADHVRAIHLFTEKNPQPDVASFRFGPRAGVARVSTRIRLSDTQAVLAVSELSDGSFWSASATVVVTLAACLEEA
ncbi:MAG TPA: SoxY-related AACIE arm protein [Methylomirabilota bacterium]|jgi:sulfur-oxidizing protein SoxY